MVLGQAERAESSLVTKVYVHAEILHSALNGSSAMAGLQCYVIKKKLVTIQ